MNSLPSCPCHSSGRRLVVAFDGTESQFSDKSSNVVEFYSRIVKDQNQSSYYNSGIGTYVKPSNTKRIRTIVKKKWESAIAQNFKSNLLSGYRWLSENYQNQDRIFLLGYSRGAYQVRVLAAMLHKVGLICAGNEEQIPFAFDIYEDPASSELTMSSSNDGTRQSLADKFKESFCRTVRVHFLGVWDTVSSVGLFKSKDFPYANSAEHICFFRHALALDERRVKFMPEYVDAKPEFFSSAAGYGQPRCKEVWFSGSHSDVGRGNKKNPNLDLGGVPSRWLAYEAMIMGLQLTPLRKNWDWPELTRGPPTDSMSRLYRLLEYIPLVRWLDSKPTGNPPQYTWSSHKCAGRNITPNQKIHVSIIASEVDYIPAANLPVTAAIKWGDLAGEYTRTRIAAQKASSSESIIQSSLRSYATYAGHASNHASNSSSSVSLLHASSYHSAYVPTAPTGLHHDDPAVRAIINSDTVTALRPSPLAQPAAYHDHDDGTASSHNSSASSLAARDSNTSHENPHLVDDFIGTDLQDPSDGSLDSLQRLIREYASHASSRNYSASSLAASNSDTSQENPHRAHTRPARNPYHGARRDVPTQSPSVLRKDSSQPQPIASDSAVQANSDTLCAVPQSPSRQPAASPNVAQDVDVRLMSNTMQDMHGQGFPSLELDHFDVEIIPVLVKAVIQKSNTTEFLQRLNLLACTGPGKSAFLRISDKTFDAFFVEAFSDSENLMLAMNLFWKLCSKD